MSDDNGYKVVQTPATTQDGERVRMEMRESIIYLMQAVYGLRDHREKAPGGPHGAPAKAVKAAADLLETAAFGLGTAFGITIDELEETVLRNEATTETRTPTTTALPGEVPMPGADGGNAPGQPRAPDSGV
jgi:hypothetical protein